MKTYPLLIDTTLRDGEQSPGLAFSINEKMIIASMLDELGIDEVEAGTPAIGKNEQEAIRSIATAGFGFITSCWCRAKENDILQAAALNTQSVNISLPVSDIHIESMGKNRNWVIKEISKNVKFARDLFPGVTLGAQDASRADDGFLDDFIGEALHAGVSRLRINDTVGILDPMETGLIFRRLTKKFPGTEFEFHGHNDLGMATANALSALSSGASCVSGTINGIGERAGNVALEELIAALMYKRNVKKFRAGQLGKLCRYTALKSRMAIPVNKPLVGRNAFRHESGIHTSAILKCARTYQFLDPDDFGVEGISFAYGKHSGTASVRDFFRKEGLPDDEQMAASLLSSLKDHVEKNGESISASELKVIYQSLR